MMIIGPGGEMGCLRSDDRGAESSKVIEGDGLIT
jgi:hypothetical protein